MDESTLPLGSMLAAAFRSGTIIDLIVVLVAAEAVLLAWLKRRLDRGPGLGRVWPTLVAGALLLLGIRAALTQAWWGWIGLLLALSGLTHLLDLVLRARHER